MAEGAGTSLEELLDAGNIVRLFKQGEAVDAVMKLLQEADVDVTEAKPDGTSLLHSFAILGCYEIVKLLWDKGARPTILKLDDSTVLHSTVRTQDDSQDSERAKILELFLSSDECRGNSMPINYQNSKGWTALKLAARKNLEKAVEVLLEHGADPDLADVEQYTPLHNAVGNHDIVKLLLSKTKNIDFQNQDGETPLYLASERGLIDSALTLLEYGADPNMPNKEGIAPLFLAARGGQLELVKALVKKGADVNTLGASQNIGPLHWAAHKEQEEVAVFLIENGGDVTLQDKEGRTPLSMASPELASKMIEAAQRVNPGLVAPRVGPPMSAEEKAMAACCGGNVPALHALLQAGVSVNHSSGSTSTTLLHMAAYCGQLPVVFFLLDLGADWRAVDKDGDTVLHFACMKEVAHGMHEKTLEFLLTTPASSLRNAQNVRGDTPIMVATRCRFVPRVKVLLRYKVDVTIANHKRELPLHRACSSDKSMEALLHFVDMTPDVNLQDSDGWTPLMYAAKSGSSAVVKYLVQRGADPNITQSQGFSALYLAAQEDSASLCQMLLEAGANPLMAGGPQKLTPLHIAAHRGCKAVCLVLIEHGGNIHLEDADGDTPLMLADSRELKKAMMLVAEKTRQALEEATGGGECNVQADNATSNVAANENAPSDNENANKNLPRDNENRVLGEGEGGPRLEKQSTFSKETESGLLEDRDRELKDELLRQNKRIKELEEEVDSLRKDKDLLLSRNKCLEDGLRCRKQRGGGPVSSNRGNSHAPWWLVDRSEFKIASDKLNTMSSAGTFFDAYKGQFRCMHVAVKVVRSAWKWNKEAFKTFQQEVDILSRLHCPYVVQFLGAYIDPEAKECTLLAEFMPRNSLHSVLHEDKILLDWNTRCRIVCDVCCGMAFLHSHQVLHRSLIPRNILIGEHFIAKLSDFGFYETKTCSNYFVELGKHSRVPQVYMAPESFERFEFTAAADVYSFGIIMCEVATGQKPFADLQGQPVVMVMKLMMGLRPSFSGSVPKEYQKLAENCWNSDPNLRPAFPSVLEDLREML